MAVSISDTLNREELARTFEYLADLHMRCADDWLHNDGTEYREIYPGFRQSMVHNHLKTARTYLGLAENTRTGHLDFYAGRPDVPNSADTLREIEAREAECFHMFR